MTTKAWVFDFLEKADDLSLVTLAVTVWHICVKINIQPIALLISSDFWNSWLEYQSNMVSEPGGLSSSPDQHTI
jgi:hypothetical protein